ncbi:MULTISPECIES: hypothetical protein [Legionella]|uniref:Ankyrin repeat protein n=1 Tax=Legionella resiliens TaxID=2905958 RepID=A0ABS8X5Q8_9GAMM|nr:MULTISPECIES: hypothetical protein [unclassified Legionella]MCE0724146.1 hypothetical protein [Legionella sp. 9fVS26]MCE3533299.1 hypothetical protein [Legionella sp. 8cVS16]QLZ69478.1 hypothetical protein FOLKNPGA_02272 [Legionella sp. PC1000]
MKHRKKPYKSKSGGLFTKQQESNEIAKSTSEISIVKRKEGKKHSQSSYVYKEALNSNFGEIEAFNGLCYRMLLGEHAAKVRGVHDDSNATIAIVSKLIPDYLSFYSYYKQNNKRGVSTEDFIKLKFPQILVAAYCEEENDLNAENFGFGRNKEGEVISVKIDHGESTYPVVSQQRDVPAKSPFIITANDIVNFPRLKDAGPAIFVHEYPKKLLDVDELVHNEHFISQKYYSFLKRILIDDLNYMEIAKATVSSEELRKQLVADKIERTFLLTTTLIAIPEFRQYINQNPLVIDQIIKEFREFNDEIRKPEDKLLRIDTQKVYSKFLDIAKVCKEMEQPKFDRSEKYQSGPDNLTEELSEEALIALQNLPKDLEEIELEIKNLEKIIASEAKNDLSISQETEKPIYNVTTPTALSMETTETSTLSPTATLPDKLKARSNIIRIPTNEREENIFAVNAVLNNDDLMKGQDGNIPTIIQEIRNIMEDIDYLDDKKIASAIIQIKDRINKSDERNHSNNTLEIIDVFSQPSHINFRVIRDSLSKNESMEKIMAPIKVGMRLD